MRICFWCAAGSVKAVKPWGRFSSSQAAGWVETASAPALPARFPLSLAVNLPLVLPFFHAGFHHDFSEKRFFQRPLRINAHPMKSCGVFTRHSYAHAAQRGKFSRRKLPPPAVACPGYRSGLASGRGLEQASGRTRSQVTMRFCIAPRKLAAAAASVSLVASHPDRSVMANDTTSPTWQRWREAAPAVPDFQPPATLKTWQAQRPKIRAQLWQLLGELPPRPKRLAVRTLSREDRGEFFLEKFQFDNGAGDTVPGYLLLPKPSGAGLRPVTVPPTIPVGEASSLPTSKRSPAILYCHWHGGQYDVGKEELFRTNATPVPAGPELAKRGFVVIAVDACGFGERNGQGPGGPAEKGGAGEMTASKFNLWVGRTLWGMMLRDDLLALDYLCSRPEVDTNRLGVTGISMGATRTWWLMALDERLKAGVAICCLTRYQNLIAAEELKAHGIYYFVPGLLNHFDTEAVVALAAPRPLLFQSGELDGSSPIEGIRVIESKVAKLYRLYGKDDQFRSTIYPGVGHLYTPETWEKTLAWLEAKLGNP